MTIEKKLTLPPAEQAPSNGPPTEDEAMSIAKPSFSLDKFKSKRAAALANVETLLTALPHYNIAQAKDFVRLHPDETAYWSPELCFANVPIKGQKRDTLHPDRRRISDAFLAARAHSSLPPRPGDQTERHFFPLSHTDQEQRQLLEREQFAGVRTG